MSETTGTTEGQAQAERTPGQEGARASTKKRPSGAFYRRRARERIRAKLGTLPTEPLAPGALAALIIGDHPVEEALDRPMRVRAALTRLTVALAQNKIKAADANALANLICHIAGQNRAELEQANRLRELELRAQEIETGRELAARLAEYRERPQALVQTAIGTVVHLQGVERAALPAEPIADELEHEGDEVQP